MLPADRLLEHLPRVDLEAPQAGRFLNGQAVRLQGVAQGSVRVYQAGALLGVGEGGREGELQPARLIARA
ncbi:tRNA pseudouridine synthase B [compost metagenome]